MTYNLELRKQIAVDFIGTKNVTMQYAQDGSGTPVGVHQADSVFEITPLYECILTDALKVVEKWLSTDRYYSFSSGEHSSAWMAEKPHLVKGKHWAQFHTGTIAIDGAYAEADSAPMAVCLAALQALTNIKSYETAVARNPNS